MNNKVFKQFGRRAFLLCVALLSLLLIGCNDQTVPSSLKSVTTPPEQSAPQPSEGDYPREITSFDLPAGWERNLKNHVDLSSTADGPPVSLYWVPLELESQTETALLKLRQQDFEQAKQYCPKITPDDCDFLPYIEEAEMNGVKFYALVQPPVGIRISEMESTVYFKNNLGSYSGLVITSNYRDHLPALAKIATTMRAEIWNGPTPEDLETLRQRQEEWENRSNR